MQSGEFINTQEHINGSSFALLGRWVEGVGGGGGGGVGLVWYRRESGMEENGEEVGGEIMVPTVKAKNFTK